MRFEGLRNQVNWLYFMQHACAKILLTITKGEGFCVG
jgi:hypothetical protein